MVVHLGLLSPRLRCIASPVACILTHTGTRVLSDCGRVNCNRINNERSFLCCYVDVLCLNFILVGRLPLIRISTAYSSFHRAMLCCIAEARDVAGA